MKRTWLLVDVHSMWLWARTFGRTFGKSKAKLDYNWLIAYAKDLADGDVQPIAFVKQPKVSAGWRNFTAALAHMGYAIVRCEDEVQPIDLIQHWLESNESPEWDTAIIVTGESIPHAVADRIGERKLKIITVPGSSAEVWGFPKTTIAHLPERALLA